MSFNITELTFKMASPNFASISLIKSFQALYNKREESATMDFTVVCQDDSEIPVHSVVLCARLDRIYSTRMINTIVCLAGRMCWR